MALEWLKGVLGEHYTDDVDKKVSAEIGKGFVAKADFNEVNAAKKQLEQDVAARDQQLETLKGASGDVDALKQQITDLQAKNATDKKNYEDQLAQVKLDNAVEAALTTAGAKNNTAVKALLADFLKDAKLADDGTVKGLAAEIEGMAKADGTAFLFASAEGSKGPQFKGMQPGSAGGNPPAGGGAKEPKDMSYDELCAYMEANPDAKLE